MTIKKRLQITKERQIMTEQQEKLAEYLEDVRREHGVINTETVVESASSPESPLHKYFEWDDTVAAQKFREHQAGVLIRRVCLAKDNENDKIVPFYVAVVKEDSASKKKSYETLIAVMHEESLKVQYLNQCKREVESVVAKYRRVSELPEILISAGESLIAERLSESITDFGKAVISEKGRTSIGYEVNRKEVADNERIHVQ